MAHLRAAANVIGIDDFARSESDDCRPDVINLDGCASTHAYQGSDVVLTFDDGTADFLDEVVPVLVEYQLPATVYVATMHVDSQIPFPGDAMAMSWGGLRDAVATGLVTVGAHTHSHRLLDRCCVAEAVDELERSNSLIEDELGVSPRHFAYPKAVGATGEVEAEVKARYDTAAIAGTRSNERGATNLHRLFRSPIQVADGWDGFRRKLDGGMAAEDDVRRFLNKYRYRGLAR